MPAPLRLAFPLISRRRWAGGYNYQRNLFAALNRYQHGAITPVVFAGAQESASDLAELASIAGVEVTQNAAFDANTKQLLKAIIIGADGPAIAAFQSHKIDVVFEAARFFGWRMPIPAIAWIPDFQHRRLPQLFSRVARWRREIGFRMQISSGRTVMLSSESALKDFREFYPTAQPACVVRFATQPPPELLRDSPAEVARHYRLPEKYFFLPNQFWRHKNHGIVIGALSILRKRGVDVVVAATGSNEDPREPGYFDNLMREVNANGLAENFRYLGMVPLSHVYALLRGAGALINPSRFEGWSTTVEEAKSFGVPMILSDLEVHREQTAGVATYFRTDDAETLANHLSKQAREPAPGERMLRPDLEARVEEFAAAFVRTAQTAAARRTR